MQEHLGTEPRILHSIRSVKVKNSIKGVSGVLGGVAGQNAASTSSLETWGKAKSKIYFALPLYNRRQFNTRPNLVYHVTQQCNSHWAVLPLNSAIYSIHMRPLNEFLY
jgi:hypothetical protein